MIQIYSTARKVWGATGEAQEDAKEEFINCFKTLETELGDKTYFGGDKFGLVDVSLIPFYAWFYALETSAKFSMAEECPKIMAWAERCMQRESVSKSLPDQYKVYDFLLELKKKIENQPRH